MIANSDTPSSLQDINLLHQHLTVLATLPENGDPLLSIHLNLSPPLDALRSKFSLWCAAAVVATPAQKRDSFNAARAEVAAILKREWPESVRSLAIFVRAGESPLSLVMPFSAHLETQFSVGSLPAIFPLVQLKDRFHRFVVVIRTEESSRIFEITLGAVSEQILATRPEMRERIGREWTREHFHQWKRENDRRFLKDQVTIIGSLMSKRGLNHLILAGHPRHVNALRAALPKDLESRVADTVMRAPNGNDYFDVLEDAIRACT